MDFAEGKIRGIGGRLFVVETSGRDSYLPTRAFYERLGYTIAAEVKDFYAPGDDKIIYTKLA
jgi:ribosomal protein S18 acetylase RimI-like enzyme